jgi:hypothetical protein
MASVSFPDHSTKIEQNGELSVLVDNDDTLNCLMWRDANWAENDRKDWKIPV